MDQNYLVSVIIPVYNVAPYLDEALESVLNQTYGNLEIIIVNDGSTDNSGELCDKYASQDSRVKVIHQENHGVAYTRNVGLDAVTGDIIAFLDPDDAFDPGHIEIMLNTMVAHDADMVMCKRTVHYTDGKLVRKDTDVVEPKIAGGLYGRADAMQALAGNKIQAYLWDKIIKSAVWDGIRFPVGMVYEDIDAVFRVIDRCNAIYILDQPLYLYRKREGSITEHKTLASIKDWISISINMEEFVEARIPEVYTARQLKYMKQVRLRRLISYYAKYVPHKGKESRQFKKWLRKLIIDLKKEVGFNREFARSIKVSYYIIKFCPGLIPILSPLYWKFKKGKTA